MITNRIKKKIFVLGLGVSGMSLALYLNKISKKIYCWDDNLNTRTKAKKSGLILTSPKKINFNEFCYLVVSPGINHQIKEPHPAIRLARKCKVKITTDLEFLEFFKKKTLIGVTGTNGKSTTTKFIEHSVSFKSSPKAFACGNIGIPFANLNLKDNSKKILVVESSSFQLDKIDKLKFDIAILLNISKDHLDWHKSMQSYIDAKLNIFRNQDENCFAVICVDDKYCKKIAKSFKKKFKSKLVTISTKQKIHDGIYVKKQKDGILINNNLSSQKIKVFSENMKFTPAEHNFQNLLATYATHFLLEKKPDDFIKSIRTMENLEHRIEFVGSLKNISFYNDSKATNIDSAITAINSLKNIFWILGGKEKKGGLKGIEDKLKKIIKAYTFGESKLNFRKFLNTESIECKDFKNLKQALEAAIKDAKKLKKNVNILLSPACSSFDQFKNYEERGLFFKKLVSEKIKYEK